MAMVMMKYTGKEKSVFKRYSSPEKIRQLDLTPPKVKKENPNNLRLDAIQVNKEPFIPNVEFDLLDISTKPKVSICIVTKDGFGVFDHCLHSIHQFMKYPNTEVLICDTGTTDERIKKLYTYLAKNSPEDKLKIFTNHTYNFSKNNNFLASKASGDILLFMNNDVFLTYDAVSEMIKYILCSNVGCLGHRLVWKDNLQLIQHDGQVLYTPDGRWYGPGHHNYKENINSVSNKNVTVEGVTAAFLMIRKELFNKVNGFDEGYKDIYQDVDLNLKVAKLGYINFCIREKALIHVDHGTRKTDTTPESYKDAQKFHNDWKTNPVPVNLVKPTYSIFGRF